MMIKKMINIIPGVLLALLIAIIASTIERFSPLPLIGSSVMALFMGIIINSIKPPTPALTEGLHFAAKKLLKFAIILLGASLSIKTVLEVGKLSLFVMIFTLLTCFGVGFFLGRVLKLNWKLSNLISAGTGICGGSAIAAIAPVIEAEDKDIAYAMSATFLFDIIMILIFPIMGRALNLSDMAYGIWSGTAINDTSSVVAAGYAYSEGAGDFATMVKLTRTLSILPITLIFAFIHIILKKRELANSVNQGGVIGPKIRIISIFPWFILGFIALAIINSFEVIPENISSIAKQLSKFMMVMALAAIGLNTNFKEMRKSGATPMLHGFIISALVVIVAIVVEYSMGIV